MSDAPSERFLTVRFDPLSMDQTLARLTARGPAEPFVYVVTPNVDHVLRLASASDHLRAIYEKAWLSLCDSRVLQLAGRWFPIELTVVTGSDLVRELFTRVITPDDSITIIGGEPATVDYLRRHFKLQHINHHNPPMGFIDNESEVEACIRFVAEHPARFVFLCVGSPRQEILAARIAEQAGTVGVGFCIGIALEFVAGVKKRAPLWMRRMGLEWFHRLLSEPRRLWRRYVLGFPHLLFLILRARLCR